jgi:hypothetical protein
MILKMKNNNKRYRLHGLIKKEGFNFSASERTIYIKSYDGVDESMLSPSVKKLIRDFNYVIQL